ncbi:hypothetical protein [Deinococcus ruber]|uniref:Uncharacterized protein n=1 Tax=Deinococcus ruber TaxID=1848197 RepID=A0A918F4W7_9DEIO|nr:hypothetical protein [Deinococcus ruber]GGR04764.1 hypothetical protein GCM10008957_17090 [Deinococcus ruber]
MWIGTVLFFGVLAAVGMLSARRQARINKAMQQMGDGPEGSGPRVGVNVPGPF